MAMPFVYEPSWFTNLGITQRQFAANPYDYYARWRAEHPVWETGPHQWMAVGFEDTRQVLTLPTFQKASRGPEPPPPPWRHLPELTPSMLGVNPPDHTRLRRLVTKAFQPRHLERLTPFITTVAAEMVKTLRRDGGGDIVSQFAFPIPATVIGELLGVPQEDQEQFRTWSRSIIRLLDPSQPPERRMEGASARWELLDYFHRLIQVKAQNPADDLLSELIAVEAEGDRLSAGELLSMALLLLVAGHETTTNLMAMGIEVLMRHPESVPTGPDWNLAIEELLRYTSPVQLDARITVADVTLSGQTVPAGSVVMVSLGAANRDPAIFSNPDQLIMDRTPNPHLAFGRGIHACLGAALARLEAQIALPGLWSEDTRPLPAGDPVWNDNLVLRGLAALPITFGAKTSAV